MLFTMQKKKKFTLMEKEALRSINTLKGMLIVDFGLDKMPCKDVAIGCPACDAKRLIQYLEWYEHLLGWEV